MDQIALQYCGEWVNQARTLMLGVGGTRRPTDILRRKGGFPSFRIGWDRSILSRGIMHSIEKLVIRIGHRSIVRHGRRCKRVVSSWKTTVDVCNDRGNERVSLTLSHELLGRIFDHDSISSLIDANSRSAGERESHLPQSRPPSLIPSGVFHGHHNYRPRFR